MITASWPQLLAQINGERLKQIQKWGRHQSHEDGTGPTYENTRRLESARAQDAFERTTGHLTWRAILDEEVCEAFVERDPDKLRRELLQVAAVCMSWIRDIDRRPHP